MLQGSPETVRKLRKPGFQVVSRSGGYPSTTQLLPIRPRPSQVPLKVLLGGGPGSGRHPEMGSRIPPQGKSLISWVNHPQHGVLFDHHEDRREHTTWFRHLGLPTSGPHFDNIERGIVDISPRLKRVSVASYQEEFAPREIEDKIREHRKDTAGYSFEDRSLGIRPRIAASKKKKRKIKAGGPGSGCNPEVGKCGRPAGPGHTEAPTVKIPRADYPLSKEQLEVQEKFAKQVESDPEKAIRDYTAKYGNILNADNAKELSPDYMKDKSTMAPAVHETASWLVKQIYKRELAQDAPPGKANMVFFTAGGAGAGKTTAVESTHHGKEVSDRAQIIYDGTLRPASSAISKIDQALNAGKSAVVAFTHRDPVEAFRNGVLGRAARQEAKDGSGRTVMLDEFIRQHTSVRDSMMEVYNRYRDHPDFHMMIFDNSRGAGNAKLVPSMNDLPPGRKDADNLRKELKGVLDDVYRQGKISRKIYEATLGEGFSHHKEIGI